MSKPSESDVAKHAYQIWEREGRPHGRDKEHWHAAEREILGAATAKEDRPIGEIRSAQLASATPAAKPPTDRQTGAAAPGRPAHPASPGMTQAAAATTKRVPQAQSEQPDRSSSPPQSGGTKTPPSSAPQSGAKTAAPSSSSSRPRGGSKPSSP